MGKKKIVQKITNRRNYVVKVSETFHNLILKSAAIYQQPRLSLPFCQVLCHYMSVLHSKTLLYDKAANFGQDVFICMVSSVPTRIFRNVSLKP